MIVDENNFITIQNIYNDEIYMEMELDKSFEITSLCHPLTYLNKILFGSKNGQLQLWNVRVGKLIYNFNETFNNKRINVLKQSTAVDIIAVGVQDGYIYLFNLKKDVIIMKFYQNSDVISISFSTDGSNYMASGSINGNISIWDLNKNQLVTCILDGHKGKVITLEYLPNSPILLSTSDDNSIKEWIFDENINDDTSLTLGTKYRMYKQRSGHNEPIEKLKFYYSDSKSTINTNSQYIIITSSKDCTIRYFNLYRDEQNVEISQGNVYEKARKLKMDAKNLRLSKIIDFSFSEQREYFWDNCVTCHKNDRYVRTWNIKNKKIGQHMMGYKTKLPINLKNTLPMKCELSSCGNFVIVGYNNGSLLVFNIQSGLYYKEFKDDNKNLKIVGICIDNINRYLVSADINNIKFWNFKNGKKIGEINLENEEIKKIKLHSENMLLLILIKNIKTNKNYIKILDIETRKLVRIINKRNFKEIIDVLFSKDGKWLIIATIDNLLLTWNIITNQLIDCIKLDKQIKSMDFSPLGDFLIISYKENKGIHVLSNKIIYDPTIILMPLPSNYNPNLNLNKNKNKNYLNIENDKKVIEIIKKKKLNDKTIKLGLIPETKWVFLSKIDLIKERNKPKQDKVILKSAPFFLPTIQGILPSFEINNTKQDIDIKFKKFKIEKSELIKNLKLFINNFEQNNNCLIKFIEFLVNMTPSCLDREIMYLDDELEGSIDILLNFIIFLNCAVKNGIYFEFIQGLISLFIKIHSKKILQNSFFFQNYLNDLINNMEKRKKLLDSSISHCLCILEFIQHDKIMF